MNIKKIVRKVFVGDENSPVECEVRRRLTWRLILLSVSPLPLVFLLMYFLYCYVNMKYFTVELLQERSYKLERRIQALEQRLNIDANRKTITEQANKDDLCRYLNSTCIGPYDFSDKSFSEIVATMLADARQNLTASGSEYSIGLSGGVDVTQEGRVVKIQVPKLPILDAFCLVVGHFNAVATYQIGCIWIRPNANAKR